MMEFNNIIPVIRNASFDDRRKIFQNTFSTGYLGSIKLNDRLVLISLISLVYQKLHAQDSLITPLKVILKITGQVEDNSAYFYYLESLAIIVEDFSSGITEIDPCGFKTSQEIINKIKELLNSWLPF